MGYVSFREGKVKCYHTARPLFIVITAMCKKVGFSAAKGVLRRSSGTSVGPVEHISVGRSRSTAQNLSDTIYIYMYIIH